MKVYFDQLEAQLSSYRPARMATYSPCHDNSDWKDLGDDGELEFELFIPYVDESGKTHLVPLPEGCLFDAVYKYVIPEVEEKSRQAWNDLHNWENLAREAV